MGTTVSAKSILLNMPSMSCPPKVLSKIMSLRDLKTHRKELLGLATHIWEWGFPWIWHGTCFLSAAKPLAIHQLLTTQVKPGKEKSKHLGQITVYILKSSCLAGTTRLSTLAPLSRAAPGHQVSETKSSTAGRSTSCQRDLGGNFYPANVCCLASSVKGTDAEGCLASWLNKSRCFLPDQVKSSFFSSMVLTRSSSSIQQVSYCWIFSFKSVILAIAPITMNPHFKWHLEAPDNYNTKGIYSGQAVYVLFKPFLIHF